MLHGASPDEAERPWLYRYPKPVLYKFSKEYDFP